jgi:hypothetical protein
LTLGRLAERESRSRAAIASDHADVLASGNAQRQTEQAARAAAEPPAVVSGDRAQLFVYPSFERTP